MTQQDIDHLIKTTNRKLVHINSVLERATGNATAYDDFVLRCMKNSAAKRANIVRKAA